VAERVGFGLYPMVEST